MRPLWHELALRSDYPEGTCWAWVESSERVCGRPEGDEQHLCPRHAQVAARRRDAADARAHAQRMAANPAKALPGLRHRLARVDAQIARLDPPPPTTDMAAYGGVGSTAAASYRARLTPDRIHRLAVLHEERRQLVGRIAAAEGAS